MANSLPVVRALSTALPREEIIYGKPVFTSIVRDPVVGPIHFGPSGPDNNRTAVHIEHVLAFNSAHYDHWTRALGLERAAWPWAFWGENLTLEELDETRLCIGDIVRCGEAVFEVSGPRTPCFKLSWRLDQEVSFLKRLVASGLVGVYLRVKTPGMVKAGDPVSIEPAGRTTITVAQVARMIGDLHVDELPVAQEVLKVRELGDTSRQLLGYKINLLEDVLRTRQNRWQGWRAFRIAGLERQGHDAVAVTLVAADGKPIAPFRAGQHIAVQLPTMPPVVRSWSLSEFEPYPNRYRITVKRQEGPGSRWLNDEAAVGDVVQVRAPAGRFVLDRSSFHRVVLVSAGVGMTPLLSMLRAHVLRGADAPAVHWLHSTTDASATFHADEVDDLLAQARLAVRQVHFTRNVEDDHVRTADRLGRISVAELEEILLTPFASPDGAISEPGEYSHFYVCGPRSFNDMVIGSLKALGVEQDQIFAEAFGVAPRGSAASGISSSQVIFARSGIVADWDASEDLTLLELAESVGVDVPFSCRFGRCGTCAVPVLTGSTRYDPVPDVPVDPGQCLTCCARPSTPALTLNL
ncbi:MOSC domain-containing protein [uncultured Sphingomonas sp.]|uniref:MOSC domain-containing protein n=1 Tax=uncultured Sphingomonas sp. TaxID=158754 RepID=UPI0025DF523B|nr:MOSC domain-containing protein [uncultured Sphingomonas sp.]